MCSNHGYVGCEGEWVDEDGDGNDDYCDDCAVWGGEWQLLTEDGVEFWNCNTDTVDWCFGEWVYLDED